MNFPEGIIPIVPVEMAEGDTVVDGIIHCGKCGEPKQYRLNLMGKEKLVKCLCRCELAEREKQEAFSAEQERLLRISNMRVNGIQDKALQQCRFENADESGALNKCKQYVVNWDDICEQNIGLAMWGGVGNGKTFAAACIANALIDKGVPVLMTSFPKILSISGFGEERLEMIDQMRQYDLVIIDDLGVERQSEFGIETVYMVIDERYKTHKPLIVTTNLSADDMRKYASDSSMAQYSRIYDRILEMCVPMAFTGETRRKQIGAEKKSAIISMLTE